jgi:hypothetical protein
MDPAPRSHQPVEESGRHPPGGGAHVRRVTAARLGALACCAVLLGCPAVVESSPEDTRALAAARATLDRGELDAARDAFASLRASRDAVIRAEGELGLARVEAARAEIERGLADLRALATELAERPSPEAEAAFHALAARASGPAGETLRAAAPVELEAARNAAQARRQVEGAALGGLIERGELIAALVLLRDVEAKRSPGDVEDVATWLERIATASEAEANETLAGLPPTVPEARAAIDAAIGRLHGTPGGARLLRERMSRFGADALREPPASPGEAPEPAPPPKRDG